MIDEEKEDMKETMDSFRKDLQDIKTTVHLLANEKQDKIKPSIIFSIVVYLATQMITVVWWASNIDNKVENLTTVVEKASEDRFYGKDGENLRREFIQSNASQDGKLDFMNIEITRLRDDMRDWKNRTNALDARMLEFKAQCSPCLRQYKENFIED